MSHTKIINLRGKEISKAFNINLFITYDSILKENEKIKSTHRHTP